MVVVSIVILLLLVGVVLIALMIWATPVLFRGGPYVATDDRRVKTAIDLAIIRPEDVVFDLGSGDGRFVIAVAQAGAWAIGFETNPWLVWLSRAKIRQAKLTSRARIDWQNLWHVDCQPATVVLIYILPSFLPDLEKKLARELRPGTRVITIGWPLPTWPLIKKTDTVFLYQKT